MLSEEEVLRLFIQLVLGLDYLHKNEVDHRDLKPANVLLFGDSTIAKLTDFGMSRWKIGQDSSITKGIGTLNYMAPEARDNRAVRVKSDMFSLGVILYNMLTKDLPSIEDNIEPEKFDIDSGLYSKEISEICAWLLKKSEKDRPNTQQLIERLLQH